ncbi:amidohydrolase family protein [Amycolatopsis jejuensis]|uniref:amidohydrolase family protein n=1 Tax=Amycolatopsis jejuensis TaxID=330084 RepID=UPI000AAE3412|nr:amidohydrolase family protein [Amycolatopsis jejuensis]
MQRVEAEILIPGRGEPVSDGVVVFDGASISYAGAASDAPETPGADVTRARVVMPGLWDCHTHVTGLPGASSADFAFTNLAARGARAVPDLRAALDAGVTSVRELGGLGVALANAVDDGPAIYAAGALLGATGGHADLHDVPSAWNHELALSVGERRQCDGPADCARAAREQLRRNAKVLKVCASGGVFSEVDHPLHQQLTGAELAAIVEVAGMAGRAVAAHCHGKPGIMAALEAGVHTIEHGTFLDEESCAAMLETGAILVPTCTAFASFGEAWVPDFARRKGAEIAARHAEAVAMAHARGVPIAAGTDIAMSATASTRLRWGAHGGELGLLVESGLSTVEAIEAATATAPRTLGPQAPRSGCLAAGYDADVITVAADPLADIAVLADPAQVIDVWRGGVRRKGPEGS